MRARVPATLVALLALAAVGACVTEPDDSPRQCEATTDCEAGKTCDDGVCYGLPPAGVTFAAVLYPPEGLALAPTEVPELAIASDGTISNLAFATPWVVTGEVLFEGMPVEARVELRRASRIPGGPELVLTAESHGAGAEDGGGFRVPLPSAPEGETYKVSLIPQGDQRLETLPGAPLVREVAPRASFTATLGSGDAEVSWELAPEGGLHLVEGKILDVSQRAVEGATVVGYGGLDGGPRVQSTSTALTGPDGVYRIYCPTGWDDAIDLVVTVRSDNDAITVTRRGVPAPGPDESGGDLVSPLLAITLPPHPAAAEFVLPLIGNDPAGGELEGASARVVATADAIADGGDELRFIASATADANGRARIWLVPGELALNRLYRVDVVTPAGSPLGSRWSAEVAVAAPGVLPRFVLPSRTYVAGRVVGHDGIAVPGTSVHPRISFRSAAALTPDQRLRVGQQAVEPVPVDDDGGFAAYLDPSLDGQPLVYDLDVTPPQNSLSPRWSYDEVVTFDPVTTPGLSYAELPAWTLPAASFARALVVDAAGVAVPGAELRVFTTGTPDECLGLAAGCVSPARLRALTAAGADGQVRRLALPDPRPAPAP